MLRYYFKINPDALSDEDWAMMVKDVEWLAKTITPKD